MVKGQARHVFNIDNFHIERLMVSNLQNPARNPNFVHRQDDCVAVLRINTHPPFDHGFEAALLAHLARALHRDR